MMRVLVWKEIREQRMIWLLFALASVGGVVGLRLLLSPGFEQQRMLGLVLYLMAWVYGLLCGSSLFAWETEEGTQGFLDILPTNRRRVWLAKATAGLCLLMGQAVVLVSIGAGFLAAQLNPFHHVLGIAELLLIGSIGYAWGLFCGAFASQVLAAVGWAVMLQLAAASVLLFCVILPLRLFFDRRFNGAAWDDRAESLFLVLSCLLAAGITVTSWRIYSNVDRLRVPIRRRMGISIGSNWIVLFWLAWRQVRTFALSMVAFSLFGTAAVVVFGPAAWLLMTLSAGILCGVTTFADEQRSSAYRFLGEQRLPLGRIWLVKAGLRLGVGFGSLILTILGVVAIASMTWVTGPQSRLRELESLVTERGLLVFLVQPAFFLTIWFVYGFAAGLIFGLFCRKPLVAATVTTCVVVPLVGLWVPSLVNGGLHGWQVWGVPVILILATRLLMQPWAAGQLRSIRGIGVTAAAFLAAGLWLGTALWYRVEEIPAVPDAFDVQAIANTLGVVDKNEGGRLAAAALHRLGKLEKTFATEMLPRLAHPQGERIRGWSLEPATAPPTFDFYINKALKVQHCGWAAGDPSLAEWLDLMFRDEWVKELDEAAVKPVGSIVNSQKLVLFSHPPEPGFADCASYLLSARGLQQQDRGDPALFVDYLRNGLALVWNMRYHTDVFCVRESRSVERGTLIGVDRWLEQLDGRPDLLRRALKVLQRHEEMPPPNTEDMRQTGFLIMSNTFDRPHALLWSLLRLPRTAAPEIRSDAVLLHLSWQVPWEKTRLRRLLDEFASQDETRVQHAVAVSPPLFQRAFDPLDDNFRTYHVLKNAYSTAWQLCQARAALLQVALRLYQAETGKPAEKLADLVPTYLPAVPADPYDGKPFRYRLSRGEVINWPKDGYLSVAPGGISSADVPVGPLTVGPQRVKVPMGVGILWCAGDDGQDDDGRTQVWPFAKQNPGEDVVFLVPLPPKHK